MNEAYVLRMVRNLQSIKSITEGEWKHELEVDIDLINSSYISVASQIEYYQSLPVIIRNILDRSAEGKVVDKINNRDEHAVSGLFSIMKIAKFLSYKQYQIKNRFFSDLLNEDDRNFVSDQSKKSQEIISCLLINRDHLANFMRLFTLNAAKSFSYMAYELVLDTSRIDDAVERREMTDQLNEGFNMKIMNKEDVDTILISLEDEEEGEYKSRCTYVGEVEDEIYVKILRESKRDSIRKVDEFLIDTAAAPALLRFEKRGRYVRIRSDSDFADKLADKLINLMGVPDVFYYTPSNNSTSGVHFEQFITDLLHENIPALSLLELKVTPMNIEGSPTMVIRRESDVVSLRRTFDSLDRQYNGFRFFGGIHEIKHVKIEFTTGRTRRESHIYTLKISPIDDRSLFIEFLGTGGTLTKRNNCIRLLQDFRIYANEGTDGTE